MTTMRWIVALCLSWAFCWASAEPSRQADLLRVIQSDAPQQRRADACRELALIADETVVDPLAGYLSDPAIGRGVRSVLEKVPSQRVDTVLRQALVKLDGLALVGVIQSVAARRDPEAVPTLVAHAASTNDAIARAAVTAIGQIGGDTAAQALASLLATSSRERLDNVAEACLEAASRQHGLSADRRVQNLRNAVLRSAASAPIRSAALHDVVLADGSGGQLLAELQSPDPLHFTIALTAAREMKRVPSTASLLPIISAQPAERQAQLVALIGERGDSAAHTWLESQVAGNVPEPMKQAAIGALGRLAHVESVPLLLDLCSGSNTQLAAAAGLALAGFPDEVVVAASSDYWQHAEPSRRLAVVELTRRMRLLGAMPSLMEHVSDADPAVARASLAALDEMAGPSEVPALIELLLKQPGNAGVEKALLAACRPRDPAPARGMQLLHAEYGVLPAGRKADVTAKVIARAASGVLDIPATNLEFGDPAPGLVKTLEVLTLVNSVTNRQTVPEGDVLHLAVPMMDRPLVDAILAAVPRANPAARIGLLRVLRTSGAPEALELARAALQEPAPELRGAALRIVCDWPTWDARPLLESLAGDQKDPKSAILALRGLIRLVAESQIPASEKIAVLRTVFTLATRDEERLLAISALGQTASLEALPLLMEGMPNPALADAAALAILGFAERVLPPRDPRINQGLQAIKAFARDPDLLRRATVLRPDAPWTPLLNGKDLAGWQHVGKGIFRVEDGLLLGTQLDGQGGDLFTTSVWDNVEIRFSYKMKWPGNSGLWFRDQYQFDILKYPKPIAFSGTLYSPKRFFVFINKDESVEHRDDWNEARVLANGDQIAFWLNGKLIGVSRDSLYAKGRIGIQVHGGNEMKGMEIRIRNLEVRPLPLSENGSS